MADDADFSEFVAARSRHLLHVAYLLTNDVNRAQDLLQEALARSWFAWRRITGADPEAYVRKVMVNVYVSGLRRKSSAEITTASLAEHGHGDATETVERRIQLIAALRRLPPRQRALIVLRYFEDLSEAQAADTLGCSIGAVKSQTSRALARLRVDPNLTDGRADRQPVAILPVTEGAAR